MNTPATICENGKSFRGRFLQVLAVVGGIVLGQAVLYGPSLTGQKILLPLDILAQPGVYIPATPGRTNITPQNLLLSDLVYQFEPARRFAGSELRQGRFPLWASYHYGGAPFVWPKYSAFLFLTAVIKSPAVLAWVQLGAALTAGLGMYFFCRRALTVGFWPATVCAWCYPLSAFFVLWQGFPTGLAVYWLPWLFLAVDQTVRNVRPPAIAGLSVVTFLVLTSGHIDVAGQALLGSGIYALWRWCNEHGGAWLGRKSVKALVALVAGWGLGFLLATPHVLPLLDYARTGARMTFRSGGAEERPPTGWRALPQVVLPDLYGSTERNSAFIAPESETNLSESASAAYVGVLATLLAAPLAFCHRRFRADNGFWLFLAGFGLSWCLNLPGFVQLLRLPVLNMMSHNRLVFLTAFALLALTAIGLEAMSGGQVGRRWWFWVPAFLLATLGGWCVYRSIVLPQTLSTQQAMDALYARRWGLATSGDVRQIQAWFVRHYTIMAEFCAVGVCGWLWLRAKRNAASRWVPALGVLLAADLLRFDYGRNPQCDPALYYPDIPALQAVAHATPGRIIGGLPASLAFMQGLSDIRGYDSVDPARMVDLLRTTNVRPSTNLSYAETALLVPRGKLAPPAGAELPPVLDMLNVRYVICRGSPPEFLRPVFQSSDYWVLVNSNALPRVYVPRAVKTVAAGRVLEELTSPQFHPADAAFVESPVELPDQCRGLVEIADENPTRVRISARMETPGLIVLADLWDSGWRAFWNGQPVPVLRVNHAVRGVVVPAGTGILEFRYQPASVRLGLWLAGSAALVLLSWLAADHWRSRSRPAAPPQDSPPNFPSAV